VSDMSNPLDIDKVMAALSNPTTKENTDSLMGLAQEANKILSEFEKTCKTLENMHILPAIVRAVGVKYDIDVDTPLSDGVKAKTAYHKLVFDRLNNMSEEEIGTLLVSSQDVVKNEHSKSSDTGNDY